MANNRSRKPYALIAILLIAALLVFIYTGAYTGISEKQAIEIFDERFENTSPITEIELDPDCRYTGRPCWKAEIQTENKTIEAAIEAGGGGGGGSVYEETTCEGWHCNPINCVYTYTETTGEGDRIYYNTGCENPRPTCDADSEICRPCGSKNDCLRLVVHYIIALDIGEIVTSYEYSIVSTGINGYHDGREEECTIYNGENQLYYEIVSHSECEQKVLSYIDCVSGSCVML